MGSEMCIRDRCMSFVLLIASQTLGKLGWKRSLKARRNLDAAISLSTIFSFYTEPEYTFHNDKLINLAKRMGPADQALFPVDARAINWEHYLRKVHMAGLNCYALKGKSQTATNRKIVATSQKQAA